MPRQFRPLRTWRFWVGWLILLTVGLRVAYLTWHDDRPRDLAEGEYVVSFVIDGDTLILDDGKRVRLIGVDTPETHERDKPAERWGPEADAFARNFVEQAGGKLRLQFDDERLDKYGRYLAYAWSGGTLLNEELIRAGLGRFTPGFRFSGTMKRRFATAEREAKSRGVGIWSASSARVPASH
jgi:micrococcal nuclease